MSLLLSQPRHRPLSRHSWLGGCWQWLQQFVFLALLGPPFSLALSGCWVAPLQWPSPGWVWRWLFGEHVPCLLHLQLLLVMCCMSDTWVSLQPCAWMSYQHPTYDQLLFCGTAYQKCSHFPDSTSTDTAAAKVKRLQPPRSMHHHHACCRDNSALCVPSFTHTSTWGYAFMQGVVQAACHASGCSATAPPPRSGGPSPPFQEAVRTRSLLQ